jgi:type I restriction enzyme S subunit
LRFPEFEGEWERYKLGDIIKMISGGTPSMQCPDYWNGSIPLVSALSMHHTYISSSTQYITDTGLINGSKLLQKDNLLLLVRGSMLWKRIPICYNLIDVAFNQDVKGISVNKKSTSFFMLYWFQSQESLLKSMVTGTSIGAGKLDSNSIFSLPINLPNKDEQSKISKIFSLLDQRISTQNKIIEQYKSLMKGITDYILKDRKANVKLKECVTCCSSTLTENEFEGSTGAYPVFGATGIIAYTSQYNVAEDSILVIKDGAGVGRVQYATGKYSVIGTLNYLTTRKNFSLRYIYYYLRRFNFDKYKVGSGIPHIYFKDYGTELIYCPSIEEQGKIAQILFFIEEKISTEKIALNAYALQKEYLLRNLFI